MKSKDKDDHLNNSAELLPLHLLSSGKTKNIYHLPPTPDSTYPLVLIQSGDDVTAGDGEHRDVIPGKGEVATQITEGIFDYLWRNGLRTHHLTPFDLSDQYLNERITNDFLESAGDTRDHCIKDLLKPNTFIAELVEMIPIEFVVRRIAWGSYLKRNRNVKSGTIFDNLVIEAFYKDNAQHDPFMVADPVSGDVHFYEAKKPLSEGFIETVSFNKIGYSSRDMLMYVLLTGSDIARRAFELLETGFAREGVTLVDCKFEVGSVEYDQTIVLADVIDGDSMRLWPNGNPEEKLDKDRYRDYVNNDLFKGGNLPPILENYQVILSLVNNMRMALR